jgi:hypothetical protein
MFPCKKIILQTKFYNLRILPHLAKHRYHINVSRFFRGFQGCGNLRNFFVIFLMGLAMTPCKVADIHILLMSPDVTDGWRSSPGQTCLREDITESEIKKLAPNKV